MSVLTYVYALCPTRTQHASLERMLENQRHLYNAALQERREAWSKSRMSVTFHDQTRSLTEIRSFDAAYGGVPYKVSQWTLKRLDDAFKAFFRRVKAKGGRAGFPRFKGQDGWNSFGFHQKDGLRLKNGRLFLSGGIVGALRVRMHRDLPDDGALKSAVFTREGRRWRVALTIVTSSQFEHAAAGTAVGIDVGIEFLATTSNGVHHDNLRPRSRRAAELRHAARALARCRKGSKRRQKVRARLARAQRRVRNARTTRLHDVANAIVASAETVFVEKLALKNMTRSASGTLAEPGTNVRQKAGLNRSMADAAPGRLISMLRYKAERAGGVVLEVDPKGTSQACSACGSVVPKPLSERRHVCACGADLHRDHNAALNILARGLAAHGAARRPGEPNVADRRMRAPGSAEPLAA